jgi:hypothetical protein
LHKFMRFKNNFGQARSFALENFISVLYQNEIFSCSAY